LFLFEVKNLIYYYPGENRPALNGISLKVKEGEFVLLAGRSGSGKSSLVRALAGLLPDFYGGRWGGQVIYRSRDMRKMDRRALAREVGMVFQDPEKQLVMTSVEAEIAFGLENLGLSQPEMFRRLAEVMSFLELTGMRHEFTANLSSGQKQKLVLAAVLAMRPQTIILDEPTSQLDPIAAEDILNLVKRLNEEMGITIILIEQRMERCFHLADRVLVMDGGLIVQDGTPREVAEGSGQMAVSFVPPVTRLFTRLGSPQIPVTVKKGRELLHPYFSSGGRAGAEPGDIEPEKKGEPVVDISNVWFTYPNGKEALQDITLAMNSGEMVAVMGENGAGKSTLLKIMVGILKPGRGKVHIGRGGNQKKVGYDTAYLSQNPNDYLFQETVYEELCFTLKNFGLNDDGIVNDLLERLQIKQYRANNPRDLSSGERQRVALASVLVGRPKLLVLDEPTRGMDYILKAELGSFLWQLTLSGVCVVCVTHDTEFVGEYASRVVMMYAGRVVSDGSKRKVLGKSLFYAPQIGKLCSGLLDGVLTFNEAEKVIGSAITFKSNGKENAQG